MKQVTAILAIVALLPLVLFAVAAIDDPTNALDDLNAVVCVRSPLVFAPPAAGRLVAWQQPPSACGVNGEAFHPPQLG
jgi:hypothetical protein